MPKITLQSMQNMLMGRLGAYASIQRRRVLCSQSVWTGSSRTQGPARGQGCHETADPHGRALDITYALPANTHPSRRYDHITVNIILSNTRDIVLQLQTHILDVFCSYWCLLPINLSVHSLIYFAPFFDQRQYVFTLSMPRPLHRNDRKCPACS